MIGILKNTKFMAVTIGVLLLIMSVMGWQLKREIGNASTLQANNQQLEQVIQDNSKAMVELRKERDLLEESFTQSRQREREVRARSKQREAAMQTEISQWRRQYEDLDNYLSTHVPESFERWLRQRASGSDQDRGDSRPGS